MKLYKYLCEDKREYVLSKQMLRSGTSIGANVKEGLFAQTRPDFASKLCVAQKEVAETEYWLELLHETDYLTDEEAESVLADCRELLKLLQSITKTLYKKIRC